MRVLLDENLPRRLKRYFAEEVDVMTVREQGWSGKKNGDLLQEAQTVFDAFVTTDQGIPHQQNLALFSIAIILLEARSNRLVDLLPLMPRVNEVLAMVLPGELVRVTT
jgi:predicted nuclease of predicted toxin-antitoxin system